MRAQKGKKVETTTTTPAIVKRASPAAPAPVKPATPTKSVPAPAPKVVEKKIETPKPVVAPSSSTSGDDFSIDFGSFFSEYMQSTPAPMKKVEAPKPVVVETPKPVLVETPKPVVVETPKPVVIEAPKPVVAAPSSSSSDDLSIDFGSFFSQYMESSPAPVKKEKEGKGSGSVQESLGETFFFCGEAQARSRQGELFKHAEIRTETEKGKNSRRESKTNVYVSTNGPS